MNPLLIVLLLITILSPQHGVNVVEAASSDVKTPSSSGVIALNAQNFDSNLRDGKVWLVEFYAPWCVYFIQLPSFV